ncbi:L,D-transpeptidase family protein [Geomesophilobacter sediminis]|uniref:L,D-transpeptidase family protein n=1 Tax=Geomesophilobacter sediminis TaxID=2798584 RepID=A0A8J7J7H8_9BACT|nr:L,D-transpeptidase family protein [Geomesophilobacter sediminis]MBJ6725201.1 L,D-transpeptidase family protein [Geomesophilobacter sediminis]
MRISSIFTILLALALALPVVVRSEPGPASLYADRLVVIKSQKRLFLYREGTLLKTYKVALGKKMGPKTRQGDCRTPEGSYRIDGRRRDSRFYKALHISYPNADDERNAHSTGCLPGGNIEIHGLPKGYEDLAAIHTRHNWTSGCIAVSNQEIDELWQLVPDGTPIEIRP